MVRFAIAGLAMLALAGAVAAEEDQGPALVDLFARTCALRPALPSEIERTATGLGFVKDGGPISADMEAGPQIDILYMARLTKRGENVGMTAYFSGPVDGPTVICSLTTIGVSAEALPGLIERTLNAHDQTEKAANDGNRLVANWRVGAAGSDDTLEISAWRTPPRRTSISITYRGRKR
ncbi:hypothetical protein ACFFWD_18440 [Bradyrhizobium erythrophlei]|uniref:hypothetical protein n=1 Tax=Bradyrhizobium erythrophlei TaxID=1437360 RepID=UPI0035EBB0B3